MNTHPCDCIFCMNPRLFLIEQTEESLLHVVNHKRDAAHSIPRVRAYIELLYRFGVNDDDMPYRVWHAVMGDAIPPWNHFGAFQRIYWEHSHFLPTPRPH